VAHHQKDGVSNPDRFERITKPSLLELLEAGMKNRQRSWRSFYLSHPFRGGVSILLLTPETYKNNPAWHF